MHSSVNAEGSSTLVEADLRSAGSHAESGLSGRSDRGEPREDVGEFEGLFVLRPLAQGGCQFADLLRQPMNVPSTPRASSFDEYIVRISD